MSANIDHEAGRGWIYVYRSCLILVLLALICVLVKLRLITEVNLGEPNIQQAASREAPPSGSEIVDGSCECSQSVSLGRLLVGETVSSTFCVYNFSNKPMRITGVEKSCHCLTVDIPDDLCIAAGKSLKFTLGLPAISPGTFSFKVKLFTDSDIEGLSDFEFDLSASVEAANGAEHAAKSPTPSTNVISGTN